MSFAMLFRPTLMLTVLLLLTCEPAGGQTSPAASDPTVKLFDAGSSSAAPRFDRALADRAGWAQVPEDETNHKFQGDAVFSNNRLAVVLRRGASGAEVYARGTNGFSRRAVLKPAVGGKDVELASVAIVENTPAGVTVDAAFVAGDGKLIALRYGLSVGQTFVKTEARRGVNGLCIEAPCRFVVLPDFFADDIVVDAAEIPVRTAELPSENFLLQMLGDGEAIVISVAKNREADAVVRLSGEGTDRVVDQSEIRYGSDGKIWVAVLEGHDIWHKREVAHQDAGKILRLDWKTPFAAQWRVDWRRDDKLNGSWEMIAQKSNGEFEKHGWFGSPMRIPNDRKRWTTVLGRFEYPCWVDSEGQGHLQPLARKIRFQGPAVIYPINRVKATPLDEFTVVDVVRATLGVGPCQYILDVEGQGQSHQGIATCGNRDILNPIYAAGRQKQERRKIEKSLTDVLLFARHIRGRIEDYVKFGHEMLAYLDKQQKEHPELAEFLREMETLTRAIDERYQRRKTEIKTPQYVTDLTEKFRRELLDYEGADAFQRCKEITGAIVKVGGNQDELVGECRMAVKVLRQRAALAVAVDPRTADVAKEIRRRTQQILRNATSYEAPRH